jgi:hypothetical protein
MAFISTVGYAEFYQLLYCGLYVLLYNLGKPVKYDVVCEMCHGGHRAYNTTVDNKLHVTNNRNEGHYYILLSTQQDFLTSFNWF